MSEDTSSAQDQAQGSGDQSQGSNWVEQNKKLLVLGGAGAVVVAAVLGVICWPSKDLVKADQLDSLLLDSKQVNTIMGTADMQTLTPDHSAPQPVTTLSKPTCLGALSAGQAPTYADSGYTELHWMGAKEVTGQIQHFVGQAVASFPDAERASVFVKNSAKQWAECADQTVIVTSPDQSTITWKLKGLVGEQPKIAIAASRQDVEWTCQRAMRVASNVVADATACGAHIEDQGISIADGIAHNVSK